MGPLVKIPQSHAEWHCMDLGTVLVSLGVAGIALLPRIPGLSADERRRARIQGDTALWRAMPKSDARDALAEQIAAATRAMLVERVRDRTIERGWWYGSGWAFVGWVLIVASTSIPEETSWAGPWRALLSWSGIGVALAGVFVLVMIMATVFFRAAARAFRWRNARRASGPESADDGACDEESPGANGI